MKMKCVYQKRRETGLTIVELLITPTFIAVLIVIFLPTMARTRVHSQRISCTNNLKQVGLAFRLWAEDNDGRLPMQVSITNSGAIDWAKTANAWQIFMVVSNELATPKILSCPEDERYNHETATTFTSSSTYPDTVIFTNNNNVSYFAGVDAEKVYPASMETDEVYPTRFLAGDSNLEENQKTVTHGFLNLWTNAPVRWDKTRHEKQSGNIALADGSVQNCTKAQLQKLLAETLIQTNRLLIP